MQFILEQYEYDHYQEMIKQAEIKNGQKIVITRPDPNWAYCNKTTVYDIPAGLEEILKDLATMRDDYGSIVVRYHENVAELDELKARNSSKWWKFDWK